MEIGGLRLPVFFRKLPQETKEKSSKQYHTVEYADFVGSRSDFDRYMTKFALHKSLNFIA